MNEKVLLTILLVHFIADFVMQSDEDAKKKSTDTNALLSHTGIYSLVWMVAAGLFLSPIRIMIFTIITFIAHTITDYITSRIVKKYFDKQDYHNGFVVIGIDQMLHYIQLYLTFKLLI